MTWLIGRTVVGALRGAVCAVSGARELVCGAIRGTLAWTLAPLLDLVYPPDSEPEIPMTDEAAYDEPTISTASWDALIDEVCSRFPNGVYGDD